ncbi:MAG TPA: GMC family oxidoreductase N-terminal domain-containing protein [Candidatus Elarobacter sp.]|jgi:choline dehydrogenase-like flavoprotein|nr:GMC family oxidoreductase N-terminal domain-containing protein [Candidatus Elarobacter sp.]
MLTTSQRATLAVIAETFAPADADAAATAELVAAALERLAQHRRAKLALVLNLLASPLAGLLLAGRPRGFRRLDRARRERALLRLARIPALKPAFDALSRLSLFAAYSAADENGRSAVWARIGYPGPRSDVPSRPERLPVAPDREVSDNGRISADAVVVGSGAGGGVAAALLAQAGLRVVVLEAGPPFEPVAARQREAESFGELYLEAGLCSTEDLSVSILAGACVGGGTAVNWSTSLRLPSSTAAEWSRLLDRPALAAELADAYDAVEARLGVTVSAKHNRNNAVIADGCAKLGWDARPIPRNADCNDERCGYCGLGCAYGNKRSTAATYLRDAVAAGAHVYANTRVTRVRIERERGRAAEQGSDVGPNDAASGHAHGERRREAAARVARGVDAVTADGRALVVDAPIVVLAAGTLRTPGLLARSGVTSPHLGKHLHLHPVSAISAQFSEPVEPWHGVMQSALCDRLAELDPATSAGRGAYGVVIEAAPSHPGIMASAQPWTGREAHAERMSTARYRGTLIALTRDRGEGSVGLDERAEVTYALDRYDANHLTEGLIAAARIAFAAGATSVSTLHAEPLELMAAEATPAGLDAFARELRRRTERRQPLQLFSAHQMGTARMGAHEGAAAGTGEGAPQGGVIDPEGRVYGFEGLYVADASAFPSASGVNPMLTIMALAHRTARALIARRGASAPTASPARSRS